MMWAGHMGMPHAYPQPMGLPRPQPLILPHGPSSMPTAVGEWALQEIPVRLRYDRKSLIVCKPTLHAKCDSSHLSQPAVFSPDIRT